MQSSLVCSSWKTVAQMQALDMFSMCTANRLEMRKGIKRCRSRNASQFVSYLCSFFFSVRPIGKEINSFLYNGGQTEKKKNKCIRLLFHSIIPTRSKWPVTFIRGKLIIHLQYFDLIFQLFKMLFVLMIIVNLC